MLFKLVRADLAFERWSESCASGGSVAGVVDGNGVCDEFELRFHVVFEVIVRVHVVLDVCIQLHIDLHIDLDIDLDIELYAMRGRRTSVTS